MIIKEVNKKNLKLIEEIQLRFESLSKEHKPWFFDPNTNGFINNGANNYKVAYDHFLKFSKTNNLDIKNRVLFFQKDHFSIYLLIQYENEIPDIKINNNKFNGSIIDRLSNAVLFKVMCLSPGLTQDEKIKISTDDYYVDLEISWNIKWNIEENKNKNISGWIFNSFLQKKPVQLSVFHNEKNIKNIEPNIERNDVANVFDLEKGIYGFNEVSPISNKLYLQRLFISGTQIELNDEKLIRYSNEYVKNFNNIVVEHIENFHSDNLIERNYVKKLSALIAEGTYTKYLQNLGSNIYLQLPTRSERTSLTIVIPVYDGLDEVIKCINSVLVINSKLNIEILIGYDNGPNEKIKLYLEKINDKRVTVIYNEKNLGFVKNVNNLVKYKKHHDFLILNADTIVYGNIFDRMMIKLNSDRSVASITPLSNNATIFSFAKIETKELSSINKFLYLNADYCVDVPVGHGFCMLINGDIYNKHGLFNEELWGRGYGEEVDWCLSVDKKYGLKHVAYMGGLVYHEGSVSFGISAMNQAVEIASNLIEDIYPGFNKKVQRYSITGELNKAKIKIDQSLNRLMNSKFHLFITHTYGGGVDKYIDNKIKRLPKDKKYLIAQLFELNGVSYWLFKSTNHTERYFYINDLDKINNWLNSLNIESVSVEHLGNAEPQEILNLINIVKQEYDIVLHDYSYICPRINLIDYSGKYCYGQPSDVCEFCISKSSVLEPSIKTFQKLLTVNKLRESSFNLLTQAKTIVAPSQTTKNIYNKIYPKINIKAIPHHREVKFIKRIQNSKHSRTICVLGAISIAKGLLKYKEFSEYMAKYYPEYKIVFIGYTENDNIFKEYKNVLIHGKYENNDIKELVEKYDPFCSLFLHITPETFSYTLSECLNLGLYPFYYELGAIGDRLNKLKIGNGFDPDESVMTIAKEIIKYNKLLNGND